MELWINADDFGFSKSCSDAIYFCLENDLITTTTACSNGDFFDYAISLIKNSPHSNKIGLHINLTEGKPVSLGIRLNRKFCDSNGMFIGYPHRYRRLSKQDKKDVLDEMQAQVDLFLKSGLSINHLDSHHHIHNSFRILPLFIELAEKNYIEKIRILRNCGKMSFFKKIYKSILNRKLKKYAFTQAMCGMDDLLVLDKNNNRLLELMVHPDFNREGALIDRNNDDYNNPTGDLLKMPDGFELHRL